MGRTGPMGLIRPIGPIRSIDSINRSHLSLAIPMLSRLLSLCAALALAASAVAHETVATEKPVVMPANTGKPDAFTTLPGFQVERIFFVPKERLGSWVSLTVDPKGRL